MNQFILLAESNLQALTMTILTAPYANQFNTILQSNVPLRIYHTYSTWWRRPSSSLDICCLSAQEISWALETPEIQQHPTTLLISTSPGLHAWEC